MPNEDERTSRGRKHTLVVTHEKPDFDALASLALAKLLHPGAVAAVTGSIPESLLAFTALYRDALEFVEAADIELEDVSDLVVVDTADPERIGRFAALLGRVPVTVYDHHPRDERMIRASGGLHRSVGATATLLTQIAVARSIEIPGPLASLALLGIHEDTGHLMYGGTTPDDHDAAAHLLRSGASLSVLRDFSRDALPPDRRDALEAMLDTARERDVNGYRVVTSIYESPEYVPGLAPLCNHLLEMHGADACLLVARMEGKTLVIARARGGTLDVGSALSDALAGGGHPVAAFARTPLPPDEALERTIEALERQRGSAPDARSLMSAPVTTVRSDASIADAQTLLARHGHNGLPVVDADGRLVGVISRRDIERAGRHALGSTPVRGIMTHGVISAPVDASARELERLVSRHDIGRIPILEDGALVGIVTRSDLLAARHRSPDLAAESPALQVLGSLPSGLLEVVRHAAGATPGRVFVVGGTVRDALLRSSLRDIDLVVEGDTALRLAEAIRERFGGDLACHGEFSTCTVTLPGGAQVDVATARREFYPHPGALPEVTPTSLVRDLWRRDFTINAMAVRIAEPPEFIDPFGGRADLRAKILRPLHALSFVEDATRIVRGARLGGRLGLSFHEGTSRDIETALHPRLLERMSGSRLRAELMLTLEEPVVLPALELLDGVGALSALYGVTLEPHAIRALDGLRQDGRAPAESYLISLLSTVPLEGEAWQLERFHWPRRLLETARRVRSIARRGEASEAELSEARAEERAAIAASSDALAGAVEAFERAPPRRRLRGSDVLELGLPPGPDVGAVLRDVAARRAAGDLTTFEEERAFAARRVRDLLASESESRER